MCLFIIRAPVPGRGWEGFPGAAGAAGARAGEGAGLLRLGCVCTFALIDYDPVSPLGDNSQTVLVACS